MCAAPNNFGSNPIGLPIQPTVPPHPNIPQLGSYPIPPYQLYPGIPGFPGYPPGYPIPIPIPLQATPQNANSKDGRDSDDRRSSKRGHDSKGSSHGSHRRSHDDYRDRRHGRDRGRRDHSDGESVNNDPIHTVFFCNIPYDVTNDEFRSFALKFGEISNIYPIFDKGIAFVTYNDIRDAKKAVDATGVYLHDRKVKRDFASKPPDHAKKNPCDTCSTVLVSSLEDVSKIKADDVLAKMREFGEIRSSSQDRPHAGEFLIKFYKLSDAKNCVGHNGLELRHETLKIEYLPEEDEGEDPEVTKRKRESSKRRNQERSDSENSADENEPDQQKQQQSQQQLFQMMQIQQMQQLQQLQQLQQIQQLSQPIPPPPPLASSSTTASSNQPAQTTPGFPSFSF